MSAGRKNEARSLLGLYAQLLEAGVQLRSVEDDELGKRRLLVGVADEQNRKYSEDLPSHVLRGKDRQMEKGQRLGGPVPDGLRLVVERDASDRVIARRYERAPVIERAFQLPEEGFGDRASRAR